MTRLGNVALRAFPVYLLLLVILAVFAQSNQRYAQRHVQLIRERTNVLEQLAVQRTNTAFYTGPLAISAWASERGMVAAPNVVNTTTADPRPAPERPGELGTVMEVRTIWR